MNIIDAAAWQAMRAFMLWRIAMGQLFDRPTDGSLEAKRAYLSTQLGASYLINAKPELVPPAERREALLLGRFLLGVGAIIVLVIILGIVAR